MHFEFLALCMRQKIALCRVHAYTCERNEGSQRDVKASQIIMHPLMTHIHPALRVALLSWIIGRGGALLLCLHKGLDILPKVHTSRPLPGDVLLTELFALFGSYSGHIALAIQELLILLAITSIYNFSRKDALPQTAERATWLFALSPLLLYATPLSPMTIGVSGGLLALASAVHGRYLVGIIAALLATFFMPEVALIFPGLLALGLRAKSPSTPAMVPVALGMTPLISLIGIIFLSFMLAGYHDISIRNLASASPMILSMDTLQHGISPSTPFILFALGLLASIIMAYRYAENTPKSWPLITIPLMVWPILHLNILPLAPLALLAAPLFAYLAKMTEDPALERPVLALSIFLTVLAI